MPKMTADKAIDALTVAPGVRLGLRETMEYLAAQHAIREAFAKAKAYDAYVESEFAEELDEPLDASSAYEVLRTSILDAVEMRDRARAEQRRLERTAPMGGAVGLADDAMRAMLKRIIDGEGS